MQFDGEFGGYFARNQKFISQHPPSVVQPSLRDSKTDLPNSSLVPWPVLDQSGPEVTPTISDMPFERRLTRDGQIKDVTRKRNTAAGMTIKT